MRTGSVSDSDMDVLVTGRRRRVVTVVQWHAAARARMVGSTGKVAVDHQGQPAHQHLLGHAARLLVEEARDQVHRLGLKSARKWRDWSKSGERPTNIPSDPVQIYNDAGWISWPDWLGYKAKKVPGQMLSFEEARKLVRTLELKSVEERRMWRS